MTVAVAAALASSSIAAAAPPTTEPSASPGSVSELTGDERCAANEAAGEIIFLTGFGYFPSVSVADVITAQEKGYFDEMCLDVEILPSLPGESMALLSANEVQFAAHSFGATAAGVSQGANVVTVLCYGWAPIQTLIVPVDSPIESLEQFEGTTIATTSGSVGVPIRTMLGTVGLIEGEDYLAQATGFDPFVITQEEIAGKASYRSSDPFSLRQGGIETRAFNPEDYDVTASFGSILASRGFVEENPSAAEDFVRAVLQGWAYASDEANTEEIIGFSRELTEGDFSDEAENFRWTTERDLVMANLLEGHPYGWMDAGLIQLELDSIADAEVLENTPAADELFTNEFVDAVHDESGAVIWPGPIGD
jgi:ABC-type nitrate/sulfonate/bicarbonate transport system substrate-binding protein